MTTIKTWQDRMAQAGYAEAFLHPRSFMQEEIDELRAALAQQTEPLVTYRHKDGTTRFEQYAKDPVPVWAVDVQPVAQQAEQSVWQPTTAAMDALRRFEETCTDNEGYDVPKDTMRNLQVIGLIYRTYGDMYCITDFSNHMLAAAPKVLV